MDEEGSASAVRVSWLGTDGCIVGLVRLGSSKV